MTMPVTVPYVGADKVSSPNAVVQRLTPGVTVCRDVMAGTLAVRQRKYLPMFAAERPDMYASRVERSVFTNLFQRTVQGLLGLVFRRDPDLGDDVPPVIAGDAEGLGGQWEDIDLRGTHGDVFLRRFTGQDALVQGISGILVDFPPTSGKQTREDEQTGRIRPYWVPLEQRQVVSFRTEQVDGRLMLAQLVLAFERSKPAGDYAETQVVEYRVYQRNGGKPSCALWEAEAGGEATLVTAAVPILNQTEIPVAWCYAGIVRGVLDCAPPLLDLAYLNLCHLNVQSDELTSLHYASVPVPVFTGAGEADGETKLSSSWAIYLPTGGSFAFVEHAGTALAASAAKLEALKADMAVMGLDMLQPAFKGQETAAGKRMDRAAQDSALAAFARSLQDCAEAALQFHANYLPGQPDGGSITINKDYEDLSLDPAEMLAYSAMVDKGQISLETMWQMLAQGERLPADFDAENELDAVAKADQASMEQAMTLAAAKPAPMVAPKAKPDVGSDPMQGQ